MKMILISWLSIFALFANECGQKKVAVEPCFNDREISSTIADVSLKCTSTGDLCLLVNEETKARYAVCNADQYEMEIGKSYMLSGKVYETLPNERWPGQPFEVTNLKN